MFRNPSPPGRGLALGLAVLSSACAGVSTRTPLSEANRNAIRSSRTVANVRQEEVGANINVSNTTGAMGGGLLFALIDAGVNNARAKNAEAAAAPIRTAMVGYDARATVEAALTRALAEHPLLRATVLEQRREQKLDRATVEALLDRYSEDAVLLVDFDYRFSPAFDHLVVTSVASLFPTRKASSPELARLAAEPPTEPGVPRPLLYRATAMSSVPVPAGGGKPVERWAADDAAAARRAIDSGIDEVVRLLTWDLDQPAPKDGYAVRGAKPLVYKQLGELRGWYVLSMEHGRAWLRAGSGELASVPIDDGAAVEAMDPAVNRADPDAAVVKASEPAPEQDPRYPKPRHNPGDVSDDSHKAAGSTPQAQPSTEPKKVKRKVKGGMGGSFAESNPGWWPSEEEVEE